MVAETLRKLYDDEEWQAVYPYDDWEDQEDQVESALLVDPSENEEVVLMEGNAEVAPVDLSLIQDTLTHIDQSLSLLICISICAFVFPWLKTIANKFGGIS